MKEYVEVSDRYFNFSSFLFAAPSATLPTDDDEAEKIRPMSE
jgi:hypothetical protein